jgi:plasmid maintenance system killer protein
MHKTSLMASTLKKPARNAHLLLWNTADRKLGLLVSVTSLHELFIPLGNYLDALTAAWKRQYNIRINQPYAHPSQGDTCGGISQSNGGNPAAAGRCDPCSLPVGE